jgi:putative sterol carrier protein
MKEVLNMGEMRNELVKLIPLLNGNKSAQTLMGVFDRILQFELNGEPPGFFVVIKDGEMVLTDHSSDEADIVVCGDTGEFAKVIRGEIDVTHLIASGKIEIKKGKISEMTLLNRILLTQKGDKG